MDEKYIFGLLGIVLGSALSVIFSIARELYAESRAKRKETEYLAIRMVCIFESFMEGCASVVSDDGTYHGQTDADGYSRVQVVPPQLEVNLSDVNWRSLPPELMYEILYFPNLIKDADTFISSTRFQVISATAHLRQRIKLACGMLTCLSYCKGGR
jgi:hypothetical protein